MFQGEDVSASSFGKSILMGAACGSVAGAASHLPSNITPRTAHELTKAGTRIGVQLATGAVVDVGVQLVEPGPFDFKRLGLNTISNGVMATTIETTQYRIIQSEAYEKQRNQINIDEDRKKKLRGQMTAEQLKKVDEVRDEEYAKMKKDFTKDVFKEHLDQAQKHTALEDEQKVLKKKMTPIREKYEADLKVKLEGISDENNKKLEHKRTQARNKFIKENQLDKHLNPETLGDENSLLKAEMKNTKPGIIDGTQTHFLERNRIGQMSVDLPSHIQGETGRGQSRALFERVGARDYYVDTTLTHDYNACRSGPYIPKPFTLPGAQSIEFKSRFEKKENPYAQRYPTLTRNDEDSSSEPDSGIASSASSRRSSGYGRDDNPYSQRYGR